MSVPDGKLLAAKALACWRHPEHGAISPGVLMALAEGSGQVMDLTRFVAREAVRQLAAWGREAHADWPEGFLDLLETWAMQEVTQWAAMWTASLTAVATVSSPSASQQGRT